jgi:hypothetical protein
MAVGMFLLSTLHAGSDPLEAIVYQLIVGMGIGAVMSNYIVAAQNVMPKNEMGVATSSMSLFRSIGGTVGVTMFGALLNGRMVTEIGRNLPEGAMELLPTTDANSLGNILLDPEISAIIPAAIQEAIRLSLGNSITFLFMVGAIIVSLSFIASALTRNVPLKSAKEYYGDGSDEPGKVDSGESKETGVVAAEVSNK